MDGVDGSDLSPVEGTTGDYEDMTSQSLGTLTQAQKSDDVLRVRLASCQLHDECHSHYQHDSEWHVRTAVEGKTGSTIERDHPYKRDGDEGQLAHGTSLPHDWSHAPCDSSIGHGCSGSEEWEPLE